MSLIIIVERSFHVDNLNTQSGNPVMGEYVYLVERNGRIEIHQNKGKIAEIPNDKADEVRNFKPLWAVVSGIKDKNHLIISLLN